MFQTTTQIFVPRSMRAARPMITLPVTASSYAELLLPSAWRCHRNLGIDMAWHGSAGEKGSFVVPKNGKNNGDFIRSRNTNCDLLRLNGNEWDINIYIYIIILYIYYICLIGWNQWHFNGYASVSSNITWRASRKYPKYMGI